MQQSEASSFSLQPALRLMLSLLRMPEQRALIARTSSSAGQISLLFSARVHNFALRFASPCPIFCFDCATLGQIHIDDSTEISSIMGSDTTPNGIKFQFTDRIRPIAKRQFDMRAAGLDPKDVCLDGAKGKGSQGQDCFSSNLVADSPLCKAHHVSFGHLQSTTY